jgi:cell division protein FtsZ
LQPLEEVPSEPIAEETDNESVQASSLEKTTTKHTVDFMKEDKDLLPSNLEKKQHKKNSILNQNITNDNLHDVTDSNMKRAEERKKRLQKFHNLNFNNQVVLQDLEDEPAYKRQGLELDDIEHSSEEPVSRIVLDSKEDHIEIKNNNSFLHDNVD